MHLCATELHATELADYIMHVLSAISKFPGRAYQVLNGINQHVNYTVMFARCMAASCRNPTGGLMYKWIHHRGHQPTTVTTGDLKPVHSTPQASRRSSGAAPGSADASMADMHAAVMTGASTARDAADSAVLSLALQEMEQMTLGQLEPQHILSARGPRGQRISHGASPPSPIEHSPQGVNSLSPYAHVQHALHTGNAAVRPTMHALSVHSTQSLHTTHHGGDMDGRLLGSWNDPGRAPVLQAAAKQAALLTGHHAVDSPLTAAGACSRVAHCSPVN
jgi:hypothetical protein